MRRHLTRVGTVLVAALCLAVAGAPPVPAMAAGHMAVVATMAIAPGFGDPCVDAPGPVDPAKCPVVGTGNAVPFVLAGNGIGAIQAVAKAKCVAPACTEAGTWVVDAAGVVTGWCRVWSGFLSGTIVPLVGVGTKAKPRSFAATFTGGMDAFVVTGMTSKGESVFGHGTATPNPATGGTCATKAPKMLVVAMQLSFVR